MTVSEAERRADMLSVSFLRQADDVDVVRAELARLGASELALVLKIETQAAFTNLPAILLHAMRSPAVGVMIARGDLAVEVGYTRLAEVQEEILWVAEAAHRVTNGPSRVCAHRTSWRDKRPHQEELKTCY